MEHSFKSRTSLPFTSSARKSSASSIYSSRKSLHGGMKKPLGTPRYIQNQQTQINFIQLNCIIHINITLISAGIVFRGDQFNRIK